MPWVIAALVVGAIVLLAIALYTPGRTGLIWQRRHQAEEEAATSTGVAITWPELLGLGELSEAERFDVVRSLSAVDLPAVPAAIRQALLEERESQVRELLLEAAGLVAAAELRGVVEDAARSEDPRERALANAALARITQLGK